MALGDDGNRYAFHTRDVRLFIAQVGDRIDFVIRDGQATEVILVSSSPTPLLATHDSAKPPTSPWGYFTRCMNLYIDGTGRASLAEYWWFVAIRLSLSAAPALFGAFVSGLVNPTGEGADIGMVFAFIAVAIFFGTGIPHFCALIRRLHDVGLSGWLVLLNLIPYLGFIALFIMSVLPSQRSRNVHGRVPGAPRPEAAA